MNINHAVVVGRLARDPELKALPSGAKVANFSIVTSRTYVNDSGGKVETPEFHNIVAFGTTAELAAKWLVKGQLAGVEGRIQTRSWDKDGSKQYRTEIVAQSVQFGPKALKTGQGDEREPVPVVDAETGSVRPATPRATAKETPPKVVGGIEYPTEEINPDDIPF